MNEAERLREVLSYDQETGIFRRLIATSSSVTIGDEAGGLDGKGYRRITIDGKKYRAHRLAWLYVYGRWPAAEIDHVNLVKDDNRISNLREATNTENGRNVSKRRDNTTGFKGVSRVGNGFQAQIRAGGKRIYLGTFSEPHRAASAYGIAAANLHGEFARTE